MDHPDGARPARPTYLSTWQVRIRPGRQRLRCTQAVDWLSRTGRALPGTTRGDPQPVRARQVAQCVRSLAPGGGDTAYSDSFATWPNTTEDGYRFGPYLAAAGSGARHRVLTDSVAAQPAPGR